MSTQSLWLNGGALLWFFLLWIAYNTLSKRNSLHNPSSLSGLARNYRETWMREMMDRDTRIVDTQLVSTLARSVSFFLSGTILAIAGLYAALGAAADIHAMTEHIPFAEVTSVATVKLKILILIGIFVYAFFKLAWSLRQYNFCIFMVGAAPPETVKDEEKQRYANKLGVVIERAGLHFNEGMRGFEFAIAFLAWLIHPLALIAAATVVVAVIYRREFRSTTLRAMQQWEQGK